MNVDAIMISEFSQVSKDGKLTVVGVFNRITTDTFPARMPLVFVTLIVHAAPREAGKHKLEVQLIDRHRAELVKLEVEFAIAGGKGHPEGLPLRAIINPGLFGVEFATPGPYAFEAFIDGTYAATASLALLSAPRG